MKRDVDIDELMSALARTSYWERRKFLRRITKPAYPRYLYRYRPGYPESNEWSTRLRDVLVESRLWLSAPVDFNDPFDMTGRVVLSASGRDVRARVEKLIKEQRPNLRWKDRKVEVSRIMRDWQNTMPDLLQSSIDKNLAKVGVCSLSEDARNIQMWSHYASDHRGIVLQFEVARDPLVFVRAVRIQYDDQYPLLNWVGDSGNELRTAILRKHSGWSYERERRIIEINLAHTYLPFRPEALTGIIFGCRADAAVRAGVQQLLDERRARGAPTVHLYDAKKHLSRFKIVIHRASTIVGTAQ